jgi:hypothetical protein
MAPSQDLILYFYTFSLYAREITALRGIPYYRNVSSPPPCSGRTLQPSASSTAEFLSCLLAAIYTTTPPSSSTSSNSYIPAVAWAERRGTDRALIKLLQKWTDLDVFSRACESIPLDFPALSISAFLKDREELWGREWSKERQERMRAEALQSMRENFEFWETMMSDEGKKWILESDEP